jgi:uncharacterized membrane protein
VQRIFGDEMMRTERLGRGGATRGGLAMSAFNETMHLAAQGVEVLAVTIMIGFILFGTARWLLLLKGGPEHAYDQYRVLLGRSLLIGLELLVAADIIRTVAVELTLMNLATLGILMAVRTALGWTLTVEIEGRWPWQPAAHARQAAADRPE